MERRDLRTSGWGLELWGWSADPDRAAARHAAGQVFAELRSFLRNRLDHATPARRRGLKG